MRKTKLGKKEMWIPPSQTEGAEGKLKRKNFTTHPHQVSYLADKSQEIILIILFAVTQRQRKNTETSVSARQIILT